MKQIYETLCGICGEAHVLVREPMSRHTTFRTGGPADLLVQPKASAVLSWKLENRCQTL